MVLRTRADSLNVRKNLVTRGFSRRSLETGVIPLPSMSPS